ncbi:high-temperature-induced dauer-formation protein-domain-containing protein [Choanephora cucurbitarum]|nr:high-temperature-induced dauer-formation protein-domain-containing protein [Choanephora cucurbitarum]
MQDTVHANHFPTDQHSINHLLNCCRIMTRIMPFVFESPEHTEWEERFFWTPRQVEKKKNPEDKPEYETLPCRGELLLDLTIQALFLAGFTIPIALATKESKVNYMIWENGVGSSLPITTYKDNEANRTEVLVYWWSCYRDPCMKQLQSPTSHKRAELLALENPDAIPRTSMELEVFTPGTTDPHHHKVDENAFRHYMSKMHRKQDFEFLMVGIYRLLSNPMTAANTYLPGSTKRVSCFIDVVMLCWRLIETNPRFIKHLVETERALDLTVALIFYAMDNKDKMTQIGLVRMCAFILQTLSSEKEYCVKLNKPFTTHASLPNVIRLYAFNGTYADFLIISIYTLISSTQGRLSALYPAFMLTIANISSYVSHLGVTTSSKLISMFHSMASPTFLLADEYNPQLTCYLLETLNNLIHYHYAENLNLVYAVVLHHDYFDKLSKLTFTDAVAEVNRVRQMRERKSAEEDKEDHKEDKEEEEDREVQAEEKPKLSYAAVVASNLPSNEAGSSNPVEPARRDSTNTLSAYPTRQGFVPNEQWMSYWKSKFPLLTLSALNEQLVPKMEEKSVEQGMSLESLMEFLKTLPVDLPDEEKEIYIRKFQWGEALVIWFRSMLWGQNYVSTMKEYGPWNGTLVKLFQIKAE